MTTRKMVKGIFDVKEIFVGLEVSKRKWKLSVRSHKEVIQECSMDARYDALDQYFQKHFASSKITVMYEAGFSGFGLHDRLVASGRTCIVVPPHLVTEAKVNRVKTDKRDARRLAEMLESGTVRGCYVPDRERREDRQISRTIADLQEMIVSTKNRIRRLLEFHDIEVVQDVKRIWTTKDYLALRDLGMTGTVGISLTTYLDILDGLTNKKFQLKKELEGIAKKERYSRAIEIAESIPGIGHFTATRLVLELGEDFSRFSSSKAIASFVGLTGSEHSTGETVKRGHLTGLGSGFIRSMFLEASWIGIRKDPALQDKFRRIMRSSGRQKIAIVAIARMLAVRLRACVLANKPYVLGIAA